MWCKNCAFFRGLTGFRALSITETIVIALIIIGDEILTGQIPDENLPFMIQQFAAAGYPPHEVRIIGDDVDQIASTVAELASRHTWVISSGGVGPTHDDVTHRGVARAFGVDVTAHPDMVTFLSRHHATPLEPGVMHMALLPEGADVLIGSDGQWPIVQKENCFILPGLPPALRAKIPRLIAMLPTMSPAWRTAVYLNADEVLFAEWLGLLQAKHPEVTIGSYPVVGAAYRTRISLGGAHRDTVEPVAAAVISYATEHGWLVDPETVARGESL